MRIANALGPVQNARLLVAALLAAVLLLASIAAAFAETAAVAPIGGSIDLAPFLRALVDIAIIVLGPAVGLGLSALLMQLYRFVGIKVTAERAKAVRATVDQALGHAAAFGRARTGAIGAVRIDVGHPAIAFGADYAMKTIPDTLKDLGIIDASSERLKNMVEARLGAQPVELTVSSAGEAAAPRPPAA